MNHLTTEQQRVRRVISIGSAIRLKYDEVPDAKHGGGYGNAVVAVAWCRKTHPKVLASLTAKKVGTTRQEVRAWAEGQGFKGTSHSFARVMFLQAGKKVTHKIRFLRHSVRISAFVRTPAWMHWFKGFMWHEVAFGDYAQLTVEGRRLKGLRLSHSKLP